MSMPISPAPASMGRALSLLWLFAILNVLFRDIHEMTTASTINEILSGHLNGVPVTEGALLVGAVLVELLLLAFLLSSVLPSNLSRRLNLMLAPLAVFGVTFGAPNDPDDYFFAAVQIGTFAVIFTFALRWDTSISASETLRGRYAA
ncbi:MAG: DUF6326 family protein [Pseudomonadota bacterium]